jgi:hypothetical protein
LDALALHGLAASSVHVLPSLEQNESFTKITEFTVERLRCASCLQTISQALEPLHALVSDFSYDKKTLIIHHPASFDPYDIYFRLESLGYRVVSFEGKNNLLHAVPRSHSSSINPI